MSAAVYAAVNPNTSKPLDRVTPVANIRERLMLGERIEQALEQLQVAKTDEDRQRLRQDLYVPHPVCAFVGGETVCRLQLAGIGVAMTDRMLGCMTM